LQRRRFLAKVSGSGYQYETVCDAADAGALISRPNRARQKPSPMSFSQFVFDRYKARSRRRIAASLIYVAAVDADHIAMPHAAHLNRYKRFPAGGSRGTSSIAFTIDRNGRVLSSRLVRSSGDSVLDQEAVSLARRASPVPPPPQNIAGRGAVTLSVPIRFNK
jgi:TonB family protein